jgi:hypothetical protein
METKNKTYKEVSNQMLEMLCEDATSEVQKFLRRISKVEWIQTTFLILILFSISIILYGISNLWRLF